MKYILDDILNVLNIICAENIIVCRNRLYIDETKIPLDIKKFILSRAVANDYRMLVDEIDYSKIDTVRYRLVIGADKKPIRLIVEYDNRLFKNTDDIVDIAIRTIYANDKALYSKYNKGFVAIADMI